MENESFNILNYMVTRPEIVWMLALMGAVCVIGIVDYSRCFFSGRKKAIRWIVLILSLAVAIILSPITPPLLTVIIILWLLILALASIGKKAIIDGIPKIIDQTINRISGVSNTTKTEQTKTEGKLQ